MLGGEKNVDQLRGIRSIMCIFLRLKQSLSLDKALLIMAWLIITDGRGRSVQLLLYLTCY